MRGFSTLLFLIGFHLLVCTFDMRSAIAQSPTFDQTITYLEQKLRYLAVVNEYFSGIPTVLALQPCVVRFAVSTLRQGTMPDQIVDLRTVSDISYEPFSRTIILRSRIKNIQVYSRTPTDGGIYQRGITTDEAKILIKENVELDDVDRALKAINHLTRMHCKELF